MYIHPQYSCLKNTLKKYLSKFCSVTISISPQICHLVTCTPHRGGAWVFSWGVGQEVADFRKIGGWLPHSLPVVLPLQCMPTIFEHGVIFPPHLFFYFLFLNPIISIVKNIITNLSLTITNCHLLSENAIFIVFKFSKMPILRFNFRGNCNHMQSCSNKGAGYFYFLLTIYGPYLCI